MVGALALACPRVPSLDPEGVQAVSFAVLERDIDIPSYSRPAAPHPESDSVAATFYLIGMDKDPLSPVVWEVGVVIVPNSINLDPEEDGASHIDPQTVSRAFSIDVGETDGEPVAPGH